MGNEAEQHDNHSDEPMSATNKKNVDGAANRKQPGDNVCATQDERIAGEFMGWSNTWPNPLFGGGGSMEAGSVRLFGYPWFPYSSLQMPPNIFQFPPNPQLDPQQQQNFAPAQYNGNGLVVVPVLIPMFGPMPSQPMFPMMFPMPVGAPMTMEGLGQSMVSGRVTPGSQDRVPQGDTDGPLWGRAQALQRPIEIQRQAIRRFRVGFQLDLLLILKLTVVVFVFNQDGSKDRLFILLFLAAIVYMYQTGALAPLLRWFSQSAQRAMMPPQPENANVPEGVAHIGGAVGGGHEPNEGRNRGPQGLQNNNFAQWPDGGNWWGLFKEMQMVIVGFVTSLLPGYQHQHPHVE